MNLLYAVSSIHKTIKPNPDMKEKLNSSYDRTEDISKEEILQLDSFKDWDDAKLEELIRIMKIFSQISYEIHQKQEIGRIIALNIDNQQVTAA